MIYPKFDEGVNNIWEKDVETQKHYLTHIGEMVRGLPFEAFVPYKAFFVPNDSYVSYHFGPESQKFQYEMYYMNGNCALSNYVVFPFYNLLGQIVGWVSFKPFVKLRAAEDAGRGISCYDYPTATTFSKGKYVFVRPDIFEKAMREGYIVITDGVFDAVSLTYYGVNACSVLGSQFGIDLAFYFRFVKKVFVSIDNDAAGLQLYKRIRRYIPRARQLRQCVGKDADDILKSEHREDFLRMVRDGISRDVDMVYRQKICKI